MIGRIARRAVLPALALALAFPAPAHAHADLVSTSPADGAILTTAPDRVRLTFDEPVRGVPNGIQVFDPHGDLVEATTTVEGPELEVRLPEPPPSGTTVLTWRVVSEDGHPIGGALTFSIGAPTPGLTAPPSNPPGTPEVPWTLTLTRWVGYLALFLATGLVLYAAAFLPTGPWPGRRLAVTTRTAAAVAAVAWLVALPITALYLLGGGPALLGRGSTWSSLPAADYLVAAATAGGSLLAVARLGPGPTSAGRRVTAAVAATIAVTAPALVGHTRVDLLAIAAGALHLLAGGVWLGGLAGLALTLPALSGRGTTAAEVLARFSTAAAGVLAALVATGALLSWQILGSWKALTSTTYGQLLLAKVAVVLVALLIAAWNRWSLLPRLRRAATFRPVVRAVTIEGAVLAAVLLITGFLVDTSPEVAPAPASATAKTDTHTTTLGDIGVRATLTPLTRGPATVTLRLTSAAGEPAEGVAPPVVRLSSDQATLGAVPLTQVSAGFYTARVTLPVAGTWRMQVSLRVSEFANPVTELEFAVGG
ncbi:copper resistance protein CopC [Actinoplanes sp. CA-054009]